ncbi:unnamed protein product [Symbiodinium sp. KB8]|nr:unnamed protein product [Symbiodinium sp. KB8]
MAGKSTFDWGKALSNISQATIREFIDADLEAELSSVPGIGPKSVQNLQAAGVKNTFNLVGKFLTLYDDAADTQDNCNAFYDWLGECGVASAYKNSITRLIVEKVYVLMPGMVDLSTFDE